MGKYLTLLCTNYIDDFETRLWTLDAHRLIKSDLQNRPGPIILFSTLGSLITFSHKLYPVLLIFKLGFAPLIKLILSLPGPITHLNICLFRYSNLTEAWKNPVILFLTFHWETLDMDWHSQKYYQKASVLTNKYVDLNKRKNFSKTFIKESPLKRFFWSLWYSNCSKIEAFL